MFHTGSIERIAESSQRIDFSVKVLIEIQSDIAVISNLNVLLEVLIL